MFPGLLTDLRLPDPGATPQGAGPAPLRHLTALYASRYGWRLQKPNVSGLPYGFTAPRLLVLLPCRASSSFHAFLAAPTCPAIARRRRKSDEGGVHGRILFPSLSFISA